MFGEWHRRGCNGVVKMAIGKKLSEVYPLELPDIQFKWPLLKDDNHTIRSNYNADYNCIAYAANYDSKLWWPGVPICKYSHWPKGTPNKPTLEAFVIAYKSIGFAPCGEDSSLEDQFEKVVIYSITDEVKHAARQLKNGIWVSKLGEAEDIEHDLDALDGPFYGNRVLFLKIHYLIAALYAHPSGLGS